MLCRDVVSRATVLGAENGTLAAFVGAKTSVRALLRSASVQVGAMASRLVSGPPRSKCHRSDATMDEWSNVWPRNILDPSPFGSHFEIRSAGTRTPNRSNAQS